MRVGILGSGLMGGKLGTIFARAGHEVVFGFAHGEQKLKRLARDAKGKARAGTPRQAARANKGARNLGSAGTTFGISRPRRMRPISCGFQIPRAPGMPCASSRSGCATG
jgi:3-hydroxyacyl-CoA dehydrogenase